MLAHTRVKGRSGAKGRLELSDSVVRHSIAAGNRLTGWVRLGYFTELNLTTLIYKTKTKM